jgi:hypothetical protein
MLACRVSAVSPRLIGISNAEPRGGLPAQFYRLIPAI